MRGRDGGGRCGSRVNNPLPPKFSSRGTNFGRMLNKAGGTNFGRARATYDFLVYPGLMELMQNLLQLWPMLLLVFLIQKSK